MDYNQFLALLNPIAKWLHIIAGITWIGLLYFFNFINGHVLATMDGDTKKKVVPELMPRTLFWFRWGAAWTWVTGVILIYIIFWCIIFIIYTSREFINNKNMSWKKL